MSFFAEPLRILGSVGLVYAGLPVVPFTANLLAPHSTGILRVVLGLALCAVWTAAVFIVVHGVTGAEEFYEGTVLAKSGAFVTALLVLGLTGLAGWATAAINISTAYLPYAEANGTIPLAVVVVPALLATLYHPLNALSARTATGGA